MGPALRLQVAPVKALQEDKSNKQGKDEIDNGRAFMSKAVVERSLGGQRMEQIIFDLPPPMTYLP